MEGHIRSATAGSPARLCSLTQLLRLIGIRLRTEGKGNHLQSMQELDASASLD